MIVSVISQLDSMTERTPMIERLIEAFVMMQPSERRGLVNYGFVHKILDFILIATRNNNDFPIIPDDNLPVRMKEIFQINNKL